MYRILNRSICFSMQTILHCLILSVVSMLQFSFKLCDYNTKITTLWHFFMVFPNMIYAHFISFPSFSVKSNWLLSKSVSILLPTGTRLSISVNHQNYPILLEQQHSGRPNFSFISICLFWIYFKNETHIEQGR